MGRVPTAELLVLGQYRIGGQQHVVEERASSAVLRDVGDEPLPVISRDAPGVVGSGHEASDRVVEDECGGPLWVGGGGEERSQVIPFQAAEQRRSFRSDGVQHARKSSMRTSSVGSSPKRSDSPLPRLSSMITREKALNRS